MFGTRPIPGTLWGRTSSKASFTCCWRGTVWRGPLPCPAHDNGEGDVPWEDPSAPARYLYRFGIAVEYGGRGLGRLALERIGELARGLGAVYLRLYVAHENLPAMGLYQKAGFTQLPGEFGEFLLDGTRLFEYAFEKRL